MPLLKINKLVHVYVHAFCLQLQLQSHYVSAFSFPRTSNSNGDDHMVFYLQLKRFMRSITERSFVRLFTIAEENWLRFFRFIFHRL